jgi:superfamily II DNA helicase RecQ
MRCRTLAVRLDQPFAAIDEAVASEFLESVRVCDVSATLTSAGEPSWSLLVLYEETAAPGAAGDGTPLTVADIPMAPPPEPETAATDDALDPEDQALLESLKSWRAGRATSEELPPYCVAQNRSLEQIARTRPATADELLNIAGFGPVRVDKYGPEIMSVIAGSNGKSR